MMENLKHYHLGCGERLQTWRVLIKKESKPVISDIKRLLDRQRARNKKI